MNAHNIKRRYAARVVADERGRLTVAPTGTALPFDVQRTFWITNVAEGMTRGGHAHRTCHELLFVLAGAFTLDIETFDGERLSERLDSESRGIVIQAGEWCLLRDFEPGTVVLVLASEEYDAEGYFATYDEYCVWKNKK